MNDNTENEESIEDAIFTEEEPIIEDATPMVARICIMMMIVVPVTKYFLNWLDKLIF